MSEAEARAKRSPGKNPSISGHLASARSPASSSPGATREHANPQGGAPAEGWGGTEVPPRGAAARSREAASTAQGPAQQGRGPDSFAVGEGRHAPIPLTWDEKTLSLLFFLSRGRPGPAGLTHSERFALAPQMEESNY